MTFKIRGVKFKIKELPTAPCEFPEFKAVATFEDGQTLDITEALGAGPSDSESGCCLQILLWIEQNGI